ncbi:MAG: FlgD immunoglobulin-like domain containing protein [bacterium]
MKLRLLLGVFLLSGTFSMLFSQSQSAWDKFPDNIKSRKYFKRAEWFYRQRSAPYDTMSYVKYNSEFEKAKSMQSRSSKTKDPQWQPVGPKGIISNYPAHWEMSSGRVKALDVHPTNSNIVFIGAATGGIWKTTNGGDSWASVSEDFAANSFGAIAIDPVNPEIVYAGTGEALSILHPRTFYGNGMYKSTDGGNSWAKIGNNLGDYSHFGDIVVNPHDHNIVYAAMAQGNYFVGYLQNTGVWRSTDRGNTWTKTLNAIAAYDITVHPTDPNKVYAAVGGSDAQAGFYISNDKGQTWTKSNSGLPASGSIGRFQITISESSPSILYGIIFNGNTTSAWKTVNGGLAWTQCPSSNPLGGYHPSLDWYDQGYYDLCIAVHPDEPDYVLAGNVELHRTIDGQNFSVFRSQSEPIIWSSPVHCDYHRIVFSPSNSSIAYIASDGGIFKSTDAGQTWKHKNNGISTIQLYGIASHPTNRNIIIGGSQDNGNFRTLDRGQTNWELTTTGDGQRCFFDHTNSNIVYYSIQYGALYKSTAGGGFNTVYEISPDYGSNDNAYWTVPFFMHPTDHNIIYTASHKLWRSTNGGTNWTPISSTFPNSINSLHQNKAFPEVMVLCSGGNFTPNPVIAVSTDEGVNWTNVSANIPGPGRFVPCVKTHPYLRNTIYLVRSGFGSGKIYQSSDLGANWTDISGDLPDIPHSDLIIDPKFPGYLYIANDLGVFQTTNNGTHWERLDNGMPFVPVLVLDYVEYGDVRLLRAGTYGRSIYELELPPAANPFITLIKPTGGEKFVEGTIEDISWFSNKIPEVTVDVSTDNGTSWQNLSDGIPAGTYNFQWHVPGNYSDNCLMKITDKSNPSMNQTSKSVFSIIPLMTPSLVYPANGEMAHDIDPAIFEWDKTLGTKFYTIQICTDSLFTNILFEDTLVTSEQIEMEGLTNFTKYYWRVSSRNDVVKTSFNNPWQFNTVVGIPGLIYPPSNSSDIPVSFNFEWEPVNGADKYHLQLSQNLGFSMIVTEDSLIAGNSYNISGLENNKNYYWRIKAANQFGQGDFCLLSRFKTETISDVKNDGLNIPKEFTVNQNYPNPFNPTTTIRFGLPSASFISMTIYDVLGNEVIKYANNYQSPGYYEITWDGKNSSGADVTSGIYFYRIEGMSLNGINEKFSKSSKMLMLK